MSIMVCLQDNKNSLKLGLVTCNELIKQVEMSLKVLILRWLQPDNYHTVSPDHLAKDRKGKGWEARE
jgi:hypothetical protein